MTPKEERVIREALNMILAEVKLLIAERDRLRALPVLQTCSDCHWPALPGDGRALCGHPYGGFKIEGRAVPALCPLRGAR